MYLIPIIVGTIAFAVLAPVVGCLLAGLDRKLSARMQGRVGPPILQPYYDVRKLLEKDRAAVNNVEGTYITLLDFSELAQRGVFGGKNPATFLREKAEVALTPGSACGSDYTDFARMIFATPRHILVEALDRIERALYSSSK